MGKLAQKPRQIVVKKRNPAFPTVWGTVLTLFIGAPFDKTHKCGILWGSQKPKPEGENDVRKRVQNHRIGGN
jgi:hypothetical protein